MTLFPIKSMSKTHSLDDPVSDYRSSERAEACRVSDNALYMGSFPGNKYIPFISVNRFIIRNSSICPTGCCGKEIPMTALKLFYDDNESLILKFEKRESVEKITRKIKLKNPEVATD